MTTKQISSSNLLGLVERIEGAALGSLDLDREVLAHLGYSWRGMAYWKGNGTASESWRGSALLTRSLDGAAYLVPEGCGWQVKQYADDGCEADVWGASDFDPTFSGDAATPALALCAASLKARLHTEGDQP